ncbi:flagellar hook assembly protein FlgD [Clostridium ihumii]|uniref:flagellar hook assembly protein FlgD n=1 Tax=Clostridium ihumii TaxID=1470356 RepID=UPI000AABA330|nr:flagellar hook capping FlgD N-terminal domain-containing protein [Clostridium ihumii]
MESINSNAYMKSLQLENKKSKENQKNTSNSATMHTLEETKSGVLQNATDRGTAIVQPGSEMDKNAFLRILAAELSNQDPTQPQDNTQYVTQMAQFASLEQMSNLNTTMRLSAAQGLSGKYVALNATNSKGEQEFGLVQSVYKSGSGVYVTVLTSDGEIKSFNYDKVLEVMEAQDNTLDYINFINASNLIGKDVELWDEAVDGAKPDDDKEDGETEKPDAKRPYGTVKEVFRDKDGVKIRVHLKDEDGNLKYEDGKPVIKDYAFDHIMNIRDTNTKK